MCDTLILDTWHTYRIRLSLYTLSYSICVTLSYSIHDTHIVFDWVSTHSHTPYVWHSHTRYMTHTSYSIESFMCHDSFTCVPWRIRSCDVTHSYVCHNSFTHATWHTYRIRWSLYTLSYSSLPAETPTSNTGWREVIGRLVFVGHFPKKSPVIGGSFTNSDLQLKTSYGSSPPNIERSPYTTSK